MILGYLLIEPSRATEILSKLNFLVAKLVSPTYTSNINIYQLTKA